MHCFGFGGLINLMVLEGERESTVWIGGEIRGLESGRVKEWRVGGGMGIRHFIYVLRAS